MASDQVDAHAAISDEDDVNSDTSAMDMVCPNRGAPKYYKSPVLSDVILRYGDEGERVFHGHRVILCNQSRYFEAMFTGRFMENHSREIVLKEDDAHAVEAMLKFSYGVLKERTLEEAGTVKTLKYFVELYVVADKYDVPELRKYATQEYIGNVHVYVEQIMPDCGGDQEFATLVRKIYDFECHKSENNRQFCKELVVAFSYQKFNSSAIGICLGPVLCDCIALTPEFARDILLHARQDTKGQHMLQAQPRVIVCSQCHFGWEAEYDFKISDFCPNCAQGHGVR